MILLVFNLVSEDFYVGFEAKLVEDEITLGKLRSLLSCNVHVFYYADTLICSLYI